MAISTAIILSLVFLCSEASTFDTKKTTEALRNGESVKVQWIKGSNGVWLPEEIQTTIKRTYPAKQRTNFGLKEHENQMKNMNAEKKDQKGHLVASSIGGPAEIWNLAPQTTKVNKGDKSGDGWSTLEDEVRKHLKIAGNSVEWTVYVDYGDLPNSNRPTAFTAVAKFSKGKEVSMTCDNDASLSYRVCERS